MIVVTLGVGGVGTLAGLVLGTHPVLQTISATSGDILVGWGAGAAFVLAAGELRRGSVARDATDEVLDEGDDVLDLRHAGERRGEQRPHRAGECRDDRGHRGDPGQGPEA